jgi:hypothetical protein
MIQHRTAPPPPPNWMPGAPHRYAAPQPAELRSAPVTIPGPRPAPRAAPAAALPPPSPAPAGLPYPGLPVEDVRIRPRLLWVGLAWLLFGALVLAGVATFVTGSTGTGAGTGPDRSFGSGEVATLELDPAADPLVYAALGGSSGYVACEPVGPGADSLQLSPTETDWSVQGGGQQWHAAFHLYPAVAGTYQIVCEGAGATFAVGDQVEAGQPGGGATLALLVLPLVGFVAAVTTTIIVLARRRAAQDRLFAQWTDGPALPAQQRW